MTSAAFTRQVLPGLRPEPLASYLAGLGLIRVLGEQADAIATAAWTSDGLAISTEVPHLARWLAEEYVPTPVLSPWNGGSGFGKKDKEPVVRLTGIRAHPSPRLARLRDAITIAERVVATAVKSGWMTDDGIADKGAVVREFRNNCPDELLPWLDAAIVLADAETYFPPILGTGGNDGRLDFSTNFHEQLLRVIGKTDEEIARSRAAARDLLSGDQSEPLVAAPIGQFDPGNAGGPGSSRFGAAGFLANPWSYILTVEGAVMFAASPVRRHQHAAGRAAMPFTVTPSPDGSASGADGEESRGEVWTPVWYQEFTLSEIRQLFAEARASWRGRPARRAVDFYAATRTLGTTRGVDEFTRYGLQRRNGLAFAAVPLDRVAVRERPAVKLAAEVEDWVARIGSGSASAAVAEARRVFDKRHLEFARDGGPEALARMLAALTSLEMTVGRSSRAKDAVPVRLTPQADAGFLAELVKLDSPELRVAVGLASCATWPAEGPVRAMRHLLLPVDPAEPGKKAEWRDSALIPGFGLRPLADVLAEVLIWRSRTAPADRNAASFRGIPAFPFGIGVPAADLHAFAIGADAGFDDALLDALLRAALALNWRGVTHHWTGQRPLHPDTTLGLLHPFANGVRFRGSTQSESVNSAGQQDAEAVFALNPEWATRLATGLPGQVTTVHEQAAARLRQANGWTAVPAPPPATVSDGTRIAAALVPRCLRAASHAVLETIAYNPRASEASNIWTQEPEEL